MEALPTDGNRHEAGTEAVAKTDELMHMSELSTQNQTAGTPNIKVLDNRTPPRDDQSTRRMLSGEGPRISNQGCYPTLPIVVDSPELKRPLPCSMLN